MAMGLQPPGSRASSARPPEATDLAARLHAALPQTQCTRCGYPDCAGYARAMAEGTAEINQCPPGGAEGIARLAVMAGRPAAPLNPAHGVEGPRTVAVIDENWCIGCTLCIEACPTDAILGSNKQMHTVIERYCTGCELCVPACPVDCIGLENVTGERTGWQAWSPSQADEARQRYEARLERLKRQVKPADSLPNVQDAEPDQKRAVIEAALAKARSRKGPARP